MLTESEKRTAERFNINCLVTFAEEQRYSRNISTTGIFFISPKELSLKQLISMTIHISNKPTMQCEGKVIRIEEKNEGFGIAVQFTDSVFVPQGS